MKMIKKKKGFTLAEVLITLGIIGVVSAMTIPTLIHKYKNDEYVAGMKKAYATLSQGTLNYLELAGRENMPFNAHGRIIEQFSCTTSYTSVSSASQRIAGIPSIWGNTYAYCSLPDGMILTISADESANAYITYIAAVDTNGEKQPNQYGYDKWLFLIANDGRVIPLGAEVRDSDTGALVNYSDFHLGDSAYSSSNCKTNVNSGTGYGCGGRLLKNNWVMDW